ncbi:hypothetical protein N8I77_007689 [Diaporthe amygdali]|uniref:Rhodopsin domain-containing protein n=1 Tax=Phomopsis amygdali TaxID=1214568 RepID=A0AAD9SDB6_PHOAM|nr:hypothetical protein N8I77_007689 [Diaporthe amygdali]
MSADQGPLVSDQTAWQATRPLVRAAIAAIVVDTVIVAAKTFSRLGIAKLRFWWDDFWIIVGWLLLMPICGMGMAMAKVETAWSNEDRIILNLEENEILLKIIYALLQCLLASYAATRFSILALYLRIFSDKRLRIAIWTVTAFVALQWVGFAITSVFQCIPVYHFWDRSIEGTCVDVDKFYRSVTPFNLVVDVALVIMPLPTVWRLKATNTRKWALTLLFGIGIAALVASAIRLSVYERHTAKYIAPSYTNVMILWLVIEPSIYLIAACLPAMHHIVAAAVPRKFANWMSDRMARISRLQSTVLGRSKTGVSMTSDSRGLTDDTEMVLELGTAPPTKARVEVAPDEVKAMTDPWMENQGIVVTTDIKIEVSQEDRIERIIGF